MLVAENEISEQEKEAYLFDRFRGIPESVKPFLRADMGEVDGNGLIEMKTINPKALGAAFHENPNKENLFALAYYNVGEVHKGYYPELDMERFRQRVRRHPDCSSTAYWFKEALRMDAGVKAAYDYKMEALRDTEDEHGQTTESQFVTILKYGGKFFAVDSAAWYYGPEDNPWAHVEEGTSLKEVMQKLLQYFRTQTRPIEGFNPANWGFGRTLEEAEKMVEKEFAYEESKGS